MDFGEEPGENHQFLFPLDHVVLKDVLQRIELPPAYELGAGCVILDQKSPGKLLEPQELGQDGGRCYGAAALQLCVAITPEPVVKVPLFCGERDVPLFEGLFREVEGFLLGHPVCHGHLFPHQGIQVPVGYDLLPVEAAHHRIPPSEGEEVVPKNRGVQEAVLAEYVHRFVLDGRS